MHPEHQPDHLETTPDNSAELQAMAREQLKNQAENAAEHTPEQQQEQIDRAREALQQHLETKAQDEQEQSPPPPAYNHPVTNYLQTMASLRRHLKPAARRFSEVIHHPAVERTSEVLEKTVMRPSVTLGATTTALLVGTILYVMAKHYGFRLSGSELIIALIVGGIFGALTELITKPFINRK